MNCPTCQSTHTRKNGHHRGKQRYHCKDCERQFLEFYAPRGYSNEVKQRCLKMYVNGSGFRAIERVMEVDHTTIIKWVKQAATKLADAQEPQQIPEVAQLDELQTFIGSKKNKVWLWTAVDKAAAGVKAWVVGDRSAETFWPLWLIVRRWACFWYITDGYAVYPCFIDDLEHLVSKTCMTRVEGENSRLRHYLARLHRKTFCYSKSLEMLKLSIRLLLHYLKYGTVPVPV